MRRYRDADGRDWDIVLGRESWGALLALFVPRAHSAPVRQTVLDADDYNAAQRTLDAMDEDTAHRLFAASRPKTDDGSTGNG